MPIAPQHPSRRHPFKQSAQHPIGTEILVCDLSGRPGMSGWLASNGVECLGRTFDVIESEQSLANRNEGGEAGFLGYDRTARGQVARAAVAEPGTTRDDVSA